MAANQKTISALLISPNREIAESFVRAAGNGDDFQILSDVKEYINDQVLEMRLRQWQPDVVFLDLVTDVDQACQSIRFLMGRTPTVQAVGLHLDQDADSIVRSLRAGATEFLWAPFDPNAQAAAAERIRRLRAPATVEAFGNGSVIGFASTKPGSGASTLAAQVAFAIRRLADKKVLLLDLDLMGGTIGFYLKLQHNHSLHEVFESPEPPSRDELAGLTAHVGGVDILPGPDEPQSVQIEQSRLHAVITEYRKIYDYIILDLPAIFQRTSLLGLSETDNSYLVTTAELPSLHLTRKALDMLAAFGFEKSRYGIILNRLNKEDGIASVDLEKMFGSPIKATLPNDYFSLHRVVTRGEPLSGDGELARSIESLTASLCGIKKSADKKQGGFWRPKPALSALGRA
jgi:pilus assembly protein CpaE